MSCSPYDLKDYFFEELAPAERGLVEEHLKQCPGCRGELGRLQVTGSALHAMRDEEPPRRIAFVSDKVLEPRWWQRLWQSGPQLGFAAAAMLAVAILVHAFEPAIAAAVAASEARQAQRAAQLVAETEKRLNFDRQADRVAFEETLSVLQKKFNVLYLASAELGARR